MQKAALDGEKEKEEMIKDLLTEERSRQQAGNENLKRKEDQLANAGFSTNRVAAGIDPFSLLAQGLVMPRIALAKGVESAAEAAGTVVDAASNPFPKLFS